jgi:hypothetical protein
VGLEISGGRDNEGAITLILSAYIMVVEPANLACYDYQSQRISLISVFKNE